MRITLKLGSVPLGWSGSRSVIPDLSGSWYIKRTDESALVMDSPVSLIHHDPDRSWITDPDPYHPKGMQPNLRTENLRALRDPALLTLLSDLKYPEHRTDWLKHEQHLCTRPQSAAAMPLDCTGQQKHQDGGKQNGESLCNLKMLSFAKIVQVTDC